MKKLLLSFMLMASLGAGAQNVFKSYVFTDINGNVHDLNAYLDAGKTIIMDISATWCGPCWSFHQTGTLDDLYVNHGPAGAPGVAANTTDDVIVLFIEGDFSTTLADLNGTGSNTQGNWVAGTKYPIINLPSNSSLKTDLGLQGFPSVYKICPNRVWEDVERQTVETYHAMAEACPGPSTETVDVAFLSYTSKDKICGPADYTPKISIQNLGVNVLNDASISITDANGAVVSTGTYSNATGLKQYETTSVNCTPILGYEGGTLNVNVSTTGDTKVSNDSYTQIVTPAKDYTNRIVFSVTTDGFPSELSWRIKGSNGTTVTGTAVSGSTLQANTHYDREYVLQNTGCHTLVLNDTYGDGTTEYLVTDNLGNVLNDDHKLGGKKTLEIPFKVAFLMNVDELTDEIAQVYPNPSTGILNVKGEQLKNYSEITLQDASGRELGAWKIDQTVMTLDLSNIANGNYLLVLNGANGSRVQHVQVNK